MRQLPYILYKKSVTNVYFGLTLHHPPDCDKKIMYFFSETRPLLGHFWKKSVLCLLEILNTWKQFQNPKIARKWLSTLTPPPLSPKFCFTKITQNGLKWILNATLKSVIFGRQDEGFPRSKIAILRHAQKRSFRFFMGRLKMAVFDLGKPSSCQPNITLYTNITPLPWKKNNVFFFWN